MTQKLGKNQGERLLLRVSGDFELSELELSGLNCTEIESRVGLVDHIAVEKILNKMRRCSFVKAKNVLSLLQVVDLFFLSGSEEKVRCRLSQNPLFGGRKNEDLEKIPKKYMRSINASLRIKSSGIDQVNNDDLNYGPIPFFHIKQKLYVNPFLTLIQ